MPELPEVETIRRQLDEVLRGKVLTDIEVLREKSFSGVPKRILGFEIEEVKRRSKVIQIVFKNIEDSVIIHLKMTGQLIYITGEKRISGGHPSPDWVGELPSKHTRAVWTFKDGSKLFFNDMRVFGWMRVVDKDKYEKEAKSLVPDVIDKEFTREYFFDLLKKTKKPIKLLLLDQDKIGGLGNIYVNDALYDAEIRPDRKADSLNPKESQKLHDSVIKIIKLGIKYGGASASNYVQVTGLGGTYQDYFLVYKKEGQVCKRCGDKIKKMKQGGRGTFYCPGCQK